MNLFDKINLLPDELKYEIKKYLSYNIKIILSKQHFLKYFPLYLKIIRFPYIYSGFCVFTKYIKQMLKKDSVFIFSHLLAEYGLIWSKNKKIRYKNMSFSSYIDYLLYLCKDKYKAINCKNKIYEILGNKYKTNTVKLYNNKWNN